MSHKEQHTVSESASPPLRESQSTTETSLKTSESANAETTYKYRCPYCGVTYRHELFARVHITRADNEAHIHQNGMMPEVEIEAIDDDDNVVDTISRRPTDIETEAVSVEDFPDHLSEQHRQILVVATRNAHERTYTTIAERVEEHLSDSDIETPSYSTIRRVIRRFYRSEEHESESSSTDDEPTLSGLTPKQQAIVIARVLLPDASDRETAERIGCANSYPSQVYEQAEPIIDRLEHHRESETDVRETICNELSAAAITELVQRGLAENLPIDFAAIVAEEEEPTEEAATPDWGSPVDHPKTLRASPTHSAAHTEEEDDADSMTTSQKPQRSDVQEQPEDAGGPDPTTSPTEVTHEDSPQEIPRSEIRELQAKVTFFRQTVSRIAETDGDAELVVSFARQIEQQFEAILRSETES